ncbi:serine/arginine repetitive matrix protein 2-like [Ptychodera flava]|uniref:serine/arginine repetitive matrix protein 2-like n=1 Tax=Ptychodera flava TaxID=63121 RepID=UPI003969D009
MDDIDEFLDSFKDGFPALADEPLKNSRNRSRGTSNGEQRLKIISLSDKEKSLMNYVKRGDVQQVQRVLEEQSVNVNFQDSFKRTPLMRACNLDDEDARTQMLELLLRHGADVNIQDNYGRTVLMIASMEEGRDDVIELLVKQEDLDPNVGDENGNTALIHAIKHGNSAAVEELLTSPELEGYIDVEQANSHGNTPLLVAAKLRHRDSCKILVEDGCALFDYLPPNLQNMLPAWTQTHRAKPRQMKDRKQDLKYGGLPRGTRVDLEKLRLRQFSEDQGRNILTGGKLDIGQIPADDGALIRVTPKLPSSDEKEMAFKKTSNASSRTASPKLPPGSPSSRINVISGRKSAEARSRNVERSFSDSSIAQDEQDEEAGLTQRPATTSHLETTVAEESTVLNLRAGVAHGSPKSPRVSPVPQWHREPVQVRLPEIQSRPNSRESVRNSPRQEDTERSHIIKFAKADEEIYHDRKVQTKQQQEKEEKEILMSLSKISTGRADSGSRESPARERRQVIEGISMSIDTTSTIRREGSPKTPTRERRQDSEGTALSVSTVKREGSPKTTTYIREQIVVTESKEGQDDVVQNQQESRGTSGAVMKSSVEKQAKVGNKKEVSKTKHAEKVMATFEVDKTTNRAEGHQLLEHCEGSFSSSVSERDDEIPPMKRFNNTERLLRRHSDENLVPSNTNSNSSPPTSDSEGSRKTSTEFLTDVFENRDNDVLYEQKTNSERRVSRGSARQKRGSSRTSLRNTGNSNPPTPTRSAGTSKSTSVSSSEWTSPSPRQRVDSKNSPRKRAKGPDSPRDHSDRDTTNVTVKTDVRETVTVFEQRRRRDEGKVSTRVSGERSSQFNMDDVRETTEPRWSMENQSGGRRVAVYKTKSGRTIYPNAARDPQYPKIVAMRRKSQHREGAGTNGNNSDRGRPPNRRDRLPDVKGGKKNVQRS